MTKPDPNAAKSDTNGSQNEERSYADSLDHDVADGRSRSRSNSSDSEYRRSRSSSPRPVEEKTSVKVLSTSKSSSWKQQSFTKKYFLPADKPGIDYYAIFSSSIRRNIEMLEGVTISLTGQRNQSLDEEPLNIVISAPNEEMLKNAKARVESILYSDDVARQLYADINPAAAAAATTTTTAPAVTPTSVEPQTAQSSVAPIGGQIMRPFGAQTMVNPSEVVEERHTVPNPTVGLIIGKSGMTLKAITQRTGTYIAFDKECEPETPDTRYYTIRGAPQAIKEAMNEIQDLVEGRPITPRGPNVGYLQIPDEKVGLLIGKGGATVMEVQRISGASIQIPQAREPGITPPVRSIAISGTWEQQEKAKYEINRVIGSFVGAMGMTYTPPALAPYLNMAQMMQSQASQQQQQQQSSSSAVPGQPPMGGAGGMPYGGAGAGGWMSGAGGMMAAAGGYGAGGGGGGAGGMYGNVMYDGIYGQQVGHASAQPYGVQVGGAGHGGGDVASQEETARKWAEYYKGMGYPGY